MNGFYDRPYDNELKEKFAKRIVADMEYFTGLCREDQIKIYDFLGDDIPLDHLPNFYRIKEEIKNEKIEELDQQIKRWEKDRYVDLSVCRNLFQEPKGAYTDFRDIMTREFEIRIYRAGSIPFKNEHDKDRAKFAWEGFLKTGDIGLAKNAMHWAHPITQTEMRLDCAKALGDKERIDLYQSIVDLGKP